MANGVSVRKRRLDKELKPVIAFERAALWGRRRLVGLGLSLVFFVLVLLLSLSQSGPVDARIYIIFAGLIGAYMALNIGANDVANNVGPAVGAKALSLVGALVIAAVFEAAGALLAGGDVVATVSKGIVDPNKIASARTFIWVMLAALSSAALWVNLATYVGAPVSTTHAIVGGVLGGGLAAAGLTAVNWPVMGAIASSWVISPLLGGIVAAAFLAGLKYLVLYRDDKIKAAETWVPVVVAVMAGAFSAYLMMKGLKKVWQPDILTVTILSLATFGAALALSRPWVRREARGKENSKKTVRRLFVVPLICAAALLSFAHGANDVANAVGPLAAIVGVSLSGNVAGAVAIPLWIMCIGAFGLALGLFLFGPKLIARVGDEITKLNPMRAFCVALSAAITVIVASGLGLPVSSTHIAVGGVFGVGLFREFDAHRRGKNGNRKNLRLSADERKTIEQKVTRRKLVRRRHLWTIVAAWLITVPAAAVMAAGLFLCFRAAF